MKKKLFSFLLNPFVITTIVTVVIIFITPNYFSRYSIELIDEQPIRSSNALIYFEDINNDGKTERISAHSNNDGFACFEVRRMNYEVIDQWNFDTKYSRDVGVLGFFDMNNNGFKEVSTITTNDDSIFLNIVEPFNEKKFSHRKIFVDTMHLHNGNRLIYVGRKNMISKLNNEEFYFNISSGYSGYPRNLYKYNFSTNTITKSPHLTNQFQILETHLNEGEELIFQHCYAPQNELDTIFTKRSDYSSWLTVLDSNLEFTFNPIEFKNPYTVLWSFFYTYNSEKVILAVANSSNDERIKDKIAVFSLKGKLLKEIELPSGIYYAEIDKNSNQLVLIERNSGSFMKFNDKLIVEEEKIIDRIYDFLQFDIGQNGKYEWIIRRKSDDLFYEIYDAHFTNPAQTNTNINLKGFNNFGVIHNHSSNFFIQRDEKLFLFNYHKNEWYFLKYVSYPIIFLFIYLLLWLAIKGQKIQIEKKQLIEKKIAKLQLKTVNNQLNPHFVFNAINTISEMMLSDNKLEADSFICKFSDLMRGTLQKSDKIATTLQEELDYVENYIQLQQIRFKYQFIYKISISNNVNTQIQVPKHVIYSYVENALKHGLASKKDGLLTIKVTNGKKLHITIEDNGAGLGTSRASIRNSTGSGINIMKNLFDLYNKLYHKKIVSKVSNRINPKGNIEGVKVEIVI